MKMDIRFKTALILGVTLTAIPCFGEYVPDLSNYFDQQISTIQTSVCDESDSEPSSNGSSFVLQSMNVDISPSVSFGINSVLSLSVAPEVDLVFVPQAD